ncbi:hypothetical protein BJ508DRAFT_324773 [Ascobolus immersus RN42]|uniref:RING-type domain-containing protein n=1 Tax=Ascobolus immersus RN42 TaxID=1160509 RepID=A0A3N4INM8_ASCIM|nr:hypothetical protein BJ508DRAFT_324773 [Ascobolus immersus RN42]
MVGTDPFETLHYLDIQAILDIFEEDAADVTATQRAKIQAKAQAHSDIGSIDGFHYNESINGMEIEDSVEDNPDDFKAAFFYAWLEHSSYASLNMAGKDLHGQQEVANHDRGFKLAGIWNAVLGFLALYVKGFRCASETTAQATFCSWPTSAQAASSCAGKHSTNEKIPQPGSDTVRNQDAASLIESDNGGSISSNVDTSDDDSDCESSESGVEVDVLDSAKNEDTKALDDELTSECVACDKTLDLSTAPDTCPCGHQYCEGCLRQLYQLATKDQSCYPPKCCGKSLPSTNDFIKFYTFIGNILCQQEFRAYLASSTEYDDPKPLYCHLPNCGTYLPKPNRCRKVAICYNHTPFSTTCLHCNRAVHSDECPEEPDTKALMALAAENGWARCCSCRRMVEKTECCNHMTCLCGAEFCYGCGGPYADEHVCERVD